MYVCQPKQYLKVTNVTTNVFHAVKRNITTETALPKHSKARGHNFYFENTKILKRHGQI